MPGVEKLIGAGTSLLSGAYSIYNSVRKNAAAKKLEQQNLRPVFNRAGEIDQVYNVAASELGNTAAQDFASKQMDRSLSAGIDAILKSGGSADFETIQGTYGKQLDAALQQIMTQRDRQMAAYSNAAYNLATAKDTEFQYNKDAPYKDKMQQASQLRQEAAQSARDAQNAFIGGAANYGIATSTPGRMPRVSPEQAPLVTSADLAPQPAGPSVVEQLQARMDEQLKRMGF
jgi:hypothetical protein